MKTKTSLLIGLLLAVLTVFTSMKMANDNQPLAIGTEAPLQQQKMKATDGKEYSLKDLKSENGLLLVFSCNTCPFVVGTGNKEGWEGRYNNLAKLSAKNGLGMVLVNSNEAKRTGDDSMEKMIAHAKSKAYNMPYVIDKNHQLADAVGARTTPHVYLFDKNMKLVYRGLIDDNVNSSKEVKERYLEVAIQQLISGKKVNPSTTKAMGCSIKRVG